MTRGAETETAQGIDYYRQFFVDPNSPINPDFLQASTFLANMLLGTPVSDGQLPQESKISNFIKELALRMASSRHFDEKSMGQLHPNGLIPAILAHEASTFRNNNTVSVQSSPAESDMEKEAIGWLIENIARFDKTTARGALTTGGTLSNLTALFTARERLVHIKGWDATRTPATVLSTEMAHYSVKKSARVLGPNGLIYVTGIPTETGGYKMDTNALKDKIMELRSQDVPILAIVANAGQTETGLVDNLECIAEIADTSDIFLHIDGAYGAPFVLSKRGRLFNGMSQGNSLSTDPHKYMYAPYPAGSIMFRNGDDQDFIKALNKEGEDYVLGETLDDHLGKGRIEGSMGGQGAAAALAAIKTLGVDGLRVVLDHNIDLTDLAYRTVCLPDSPFKPAYVPELNTFGFYPRIPEHRDDNLVERAAKQLEADTGYYISTEVLPIPQNPTFSNENIVKSRVFRMVISHPYTSEENVESALSSLSEIWNRNLSNKNL